MMSLHSVFDNLTMARFLLPSAVTCKHKIMSHNKFAVAGHDVGML